MKITKQEIEKILSNLEIASELEDWFLLKILDMYFLRILKNGENVFEKFNKNKFHYVFVLNKDMRFIQVDLLVKNYLTFFKNFKDFIYINGSAFRLEFDQIVKLIQQLERIKSLQIFS